MKYIIIQYIYGKFRGGAGEGGGRRSGLKDDSKYYEHVVAMRKAVHKVRKEMAEERKDGERREKSANNHSQCLNE